MILRVSGDNNVIWFLVTLLLIVLIICITIVNRRAMESIAQCKDMFKFKCETDSKAVDTKDYAGNAINVGDTIIIPEDADDRFIKAEVQGVKSNLVIANIKLASNHYVCYAVSPDKCIKIMKEETK